jgi:DNA replication licensing factor MCM5
MDQGSVYSLSLFPESRNEDGENSNQQITKALVDFILQFHLDDVFIYRDQIRENVLSKQYYCDVDVTHLIAYSEELADRLNNEPAEIIPIVRKYDFLFSSTLFPDSLPV